LILLTARNHRQDVVAGLEAGADNYLTKPFNAYELKERLRAGARNVELEDRLTQAQDGLIQAYETLRDQAMHDALTQVLNRRATMDLLNSEVSRAQGNQRPLTVMMVDIDHFKRVNDRFGHAVGDGVLCEVSRRLGATISASHTVGRIGGEEFLVVAPDCDRSPGAARAERLREAICSTPIVVKDLSIRVTVSVGVATSRKPKTDTLDTLVCAADRALYRAKKKGRNRVEQHGR